MELFIIKLRETPSSRVSLEDSAAIPEGPKISPTGLGVSPEGPNILSEDFEVSPEGPPGPTELQGIDEGLMTSGRRHLPPETL